MHTLALQKSPDRMRSDSFGKLEATDAWGRLAELFFRKSKYCDIHKFLPVLKQLKHGRDLIHFSI